MITKLTTTTTTGVQEDKGVREAKEVRVETVTVEQEAMLLVVTVTVGTQLHQEVMSPSTPSMMTCARWQY
jgi:hypothetical protein